MSLLSSIFVIITIIIIINLISNPTTALPTIALSTPDRATKMGLNMMCYGKWDAHTFEEMVADKKCLSGTMDTNSISNALDDLRAGRYNVFLFLTHSFNMGQGDKLTHLPSIMFRDAVTKKFVKYDDDLYLKKLRALQGKDAVIFHLACSSDKRTDENVKSQLININKRVGIHREVNNDPARGYIDNHISEYSSSSLWAVKWSAYLKTHDVLLNVDARRTFSVTLPELASYFILRQHGVDMRKGPIIIHQAPGQVMYGGEVFMRDMIPRLRTRDQKGKEFAHLLKVLEQLQKDSVLADLQPWAEKLKVWDDILEKVGAKGDVRKLGFNRFLGTITNALVNDFDMIRYCRNTINRRDRSTLKLDPQIVRTCLGADENPDYNKFIVCCVGKHVELNKKNAGVAAAASAATN